MTRWRQPGRRRCMPGRRLSRRRRCRPRARRRHPAISSGSRPAIRRWPRSGRRRRGAAEQRGQLLCGWRRERMAALLRGGDSGVELLLARGRVGIFTLPCATGWRPIPEADHLLCPVTTASICERVQSRHGLDSSLSARAVTVRSHGCHAAHNSLTKRTLWPLQTMRSTAAILHRRPAPPASHAASGARTSKLRRRGPSPARGSARYGATPQGPHRSRTGLRPLRSTSAADTAPSAERPGCAPSCERRLVDLLPHLCAARPAETAATCWPAAEAAVVCWAVKAAMLLGVRPRRLEEMTSAWRGYTLQLSASWLCLASGLKSFLFKIRIINVYNVYNVYNLVRTP